MNIHTTRSLQKSRRPQSAQKSRTLLRLCFAKLLVLLVGGPDDFVAGASRAHPTRPLRGGRITRVGQPDRLRRQANVAIQSRSFACSTREQTAEVSMSRLERKVVMMKMAYLFLIKCSLALYIEYRIRLLHACNTRVSQISTIQI